MRRLGFSIVTHAIAAAAIVAGTAFAMAEETKNGCGSDNPEVRIPACSALIDAPDTTPEVRAEAFFRRGLSYSEFNQYDRAIDDYDGAIRLVPGYAAALNNRAYSLLRLGKASQGLPDVEEALRYSPLDPIYNSTRGEIRQALGDRDGAIHDHVTAMLSGGALFVKLYQCSLRLAQLYHGPLDGIISPELHNALALCVDMGSQCSPIPAFPVPECPDPVG
jgi:tetratricopeptide (TPR) repeat protein